MCNKCKNMKDSKMVTFKKLKLPFNINYNKACRIVYIIDISISLIVNVSVIEIFVIVLVIVSGKDLIAWSTIRLPVALLKMMIIMRDATL